MNQQARLRVLLADSDSLFRAGAKSLLAAESWAEVVGETSDGNRTLELVRQLQPDVLLLDLLIRDLNALEVLKRLQALDLVTKTVLVAAHPERPTIRTSLLRGARGVWRKDSATDLLGRCIRQVASGELWLGHDTVSDLVEAMRGGYTQGTAVLTPREREIVEAVISGASNKTIATRLGVTEQTVKNQLRRLFARLQVANRVELALHAVKQGLAAED